LCLTYQCIRQHSVAVSQLQQLIYWLSNHARYSAPCCPMPANVASAAAGA
jgi:hypothetical protein